MKIVLRSAGSAVFVCGLAIAQAQGTAPAPKADAKALVQQAVTAELAADESDHTLWRYRDEERSTGKTSMVVETAHGSVKRRIARGGQALTEQAAAEEEKRLEEFIHSPAKLARQRKDAEDDDRNARELLTILPAAFLWTIGADAGESVTLHFVPDPAFHPADIQSRVLGAMSGELVVDKASHRIRTIQGALTHDVTIGYGLLGRLKQGGTFRVERREVAPGLWQITETHVHIEGKALFFKSIGQEQDEVQTEFTQVPVETTLEQALEMSKVK